MRECVKGEVVPSEEALGDKSREWRVGEKAVLRRRREVWVLRRGVKDWKRFWRIEEDILF